MNHGLDGTTALHISVAALLVTINNSRVTRLEQMLSPLLTRNVSQLTRGLTRLARPQVEEHTDYDIYILGKYCRGLDNTENVVIGSVR